MSDEVENVDESAVETTEVQSAPVDQASEVASDQASTAASSEIVVGNQKFKDVSELSKAYSELQKTFTKSSQESAKERKTYEGTLKILSDLRKDPVAWQGFINAIAKKTEQAPEAPKPKLPEADNRYDDLERRVVEQEARAEYDAFMKKHPDLSAEELNEVVQRTIELEDAGRSRTLEEVYRTEFFERAAAKFYSKGENDTKDSLKKTQKANAMGSVTPTAAKSKPAPSYGAIKSNAAQNKWIMDRMKEAGFPDED